MQTITSAIFSAAVIPGLHHPWVIHRLTNLNSKLNCRWRSHLNHLSPSSLSSEVRQATNCPPSPTLLPSKTPPPRHLLLLNSSSLRTEDETTVHLCHTAREIKQQQAIPQKYRHRTLVSQVNRLLIFWNEATFFCKPDYQAFFVKKKYFSPSLYVGDRRYFEGILQSGLFAFAIL